MPVVVIVTAGEVFVAVACIRSRAFSPDRAMRYLARSGKELQANGLATNGLVGALKNEVNATYERGTDPRRN